MALTEEERKAYKRASDMGLGTAFLENRRNNALAELRQDAHDRFMASRRNFIESNRGAVSPQERRSTLDYFRDQASRRAERQFELNMQGKRNEGIVGAAKAQGADAAEVKANSELERWRLEHGYTDDEGTFHPGSIDRTSRAQFGYFDDNGTFHGGASTEGARIGKDTELEKVRLEQAGLTERTKLGNEGQREISEINRETELAKAGQVAAKQQRDIAAKIQQVQIKATGQANAAKASAAARIISGALQAGEMSGKPSQVVFAELKNQYKGNAEMQGFLGALDGTAQQGAPKDGDQKTLSSGRNVVYHGGQWQYAD